MTPTLTPELGAWFAMVFWGIAIGILAMIEVDKNVRALDRRSADYRFLRSILGSNRLQQIIRQVTQAFALAAGIIAWLMLPFPNLIAWLLLLLEFSLVLNSTIEYVTNVRRKARRERKGDGA